MSNLAIVHVLYLFGNGVGLCMMQHVPENSCPEMHEELKLALDFVRRRHIGAIATIGPDGCPHVVPKGFAVLNDQRLTYVDLYGSTTLRNIIRNPHVAAVFWDDKAVDGWLFKGIATVHHQDEVYKQVIDRYVRAHHPEGWTPPPECRVVTIRITRVKRVKPR